MINLCRANGRRYFVVDFDWNCHNYRVNIIKNIPSVKIRRDKYYGNMQMMIGVNESYVELLLYELLSLKEKFQKSCKSSNFKYLFITAYCF